MLIIWNEEKRSQAARRRGTMTGGRGERRARVGEEGGRRRRGVYGTSESRGTYEDVQVGWGVARKESEWEKLSNVFVRG